MKPPIKIIKRNRENSVTETGKPEVQEIVKPSIREIAKTIEGWKAEFLRKKRVERYPFSALPRIALG